MNDNNYFRIRISSIHASKELPFNIYLMINSHYTLYVRAGEKIDSIKIKSLIAKDHGDHFFIAESERAAYKAFVHDSVLSPDITPIEKAQILRDSSMSLIEELYEKPDINKALDDSKQIITDFISFMDTEPEAMANLISLSSHDFYTYNHSLDVSIYALGLGRALSFNAKDLAELGVGALFHDVGKRNVPLDILCKKGGLSDPEWAQMQQHTHYGLVILNNNPAVSDAVKATCFEHHESFSGNGYPQQIQGQEIHPFARIVALTDTFDAMTTQRSYNIPMRPVDAVTFMKEKLSGRYDPEMLNAFFSVMFQLKAA
jgi:HD-GYP domain-containing protein (c-di-GMP phosphodiesterase class II)